MREPSRTELSRPGPAKDLAIESLRGVAIILMVAGHVIGATKLRGMQVPDDSLWRYYYVGLEDLRMPLFTVLSGFVYAFRPLPGLSRYPRLVVGKARRLLIPAVTVGASFFLLQAAVPGTNTKSDLAGFPMHLLLGYEHLWFVFALFVIFAIVGLVDGLGWLRRLPQWTIALVAASAVFVWIVVPPEHAYLSVDGAIRLLPFFLLGYGLHRFPHALTGRTLIAVATTGFVALYSVRVVTIAHGDPQTSATMRLLILVVGLTALTVLMRFREPIKNVYLARLGSHAYPIYLLHVFGAAGMRILLIKVGIDEPVLVFLACMVAALGLPVLLERYLGRFRWVSWAFLGQKPRRTLRPADAAPAPAMHASLTP